MKPFTLGEVQQSPITLESIQSRLLSKPRRCKLDPDWPQPLHAPKEAGKDWRIQLPFEETFVNAFRAGCPVETRGSSLGDNDRWYTYIPDAKNDPDVLVQVLEWCQVVGGFVGLRDCLALSFALDYDREGGKPKQDLSIAGRLRTRAKPYSRKPTADTFLAADELVSQLQVFVYSVEPYPKADVLVAIPPSDPDKLFDLPRYLAHELAELLGKPDQSENVRTTKARPPLKGLSLADKLSAVSGTIAVDEDVYGDAPA